MEHRKSNQLSPKLMSYEESDEKLVELIFDDSTGLVTAMYSDECHALQKLCFCDIDIYRATRIEPNLDANWTVDVAPFLNMEGSVVVATFTTLEEAKSFEVELVKRLLRRTTNDVETVQLEVQQMFLERAC